MFARRAGRSGPAPAADSDLARAGRRQRRARQSGRRPPGSQPCRNTGPIRGDPPRRGRGWPSAAPARRRVTSCLRGARSVSELQPTHTSASARTNVVALLEVVSGGEVTLAHRHLAAKVEAHRASAAGRRAGACRGH
eukprot:scaffold3721_cov134-Isochrysis_galbana.AAC.11